MARRLGVFLLLSVGILLVGAWGATSSASAQDTRSQLDEAARLTFESAREAFVAGDYETALERFRQAYQLSARPGLLYNIAQTLDRLRRDEETLETLRQYLREAPDAPNRAEVEARIRVLEQAIAERRAAGGDGGGDGGGDDGGGATTTPPPFELGVLHPAFFLSAAGLAVASGAVLIWAGVDTLALDDAYEATTDYDSAQTAYRRAERRQLLTNAFIGVTAGLAVTAAVLAIFTDWGELTGGGEQARARPLFWAGPGGAGLGLGVSF